MNKAVLALVAILVLPGCVTEDNVVDLGESQGDDGELQGLNIVAQTLGRDVDVAPTYDLLGESGNESTLILWAAAGCNGCERLCVGKLPLEPRLDTRRAQQSGELLRGAGNSSYSHSTNGAITHPWLETPATAILLMAPSSN